MSDMTFIDVSELSELQNKLAYTQHQREMGLKEIERLNMRVRELEENDKIKQGSK